MIKKLFLGAALVAASCNAQVPDGECQVSIKLSNIDDTLIAYLLDENMAQPVSIDTLQAVNGEFTYSAKINDTRVCVFVAKNQQASVQTYLVPGNQLVVTGDAKSEYHISGSALYDDLDKATSVGDAFSASIKAIQQEYSNRLNAGESPEALQQEIVPRYDAIMSEMQAAEAKYIEENPQTQGAVLLLSNMRGEAFAKYDAVVTDEAKAGAMAVLYKSAKAAYEREQARQKAAEALAPGNMAPDFTLPTLDGGELSLSSLRGKYVIIDFWGAWCGWCIKGMPDMKRYYEKYGKNLEILGIDCRDTDDKWRAAVEKHGLTWKHVKNGDGDSDITVKYAIQGFPTKVLVDPEGKIVRVIVGEDPEFYVLLDEVLGKE